MYLQDKTTSDGNNYGREIMTEENFIKSDYYTDLRAPEIEAWRQRLSQNSKKVIQNLFSQSTQKQFSTGTTKTKTVT